MNKENKIMSAWVEQMVGELVRERPSRSRVFEQFGIDFCCGGKQSLADACRVKGLALESVVDALRVADAEPAPDDVDWSRRSLTELCDHIIERHHNWLREELPRIEFMALKVARVHGAAHPEMIEVARVFELLKDELTMHMRKEEEILFPFVRNMEQTSRVPEFHCGSVANPIRVMEAEHDNAGRALHEMNRLTGGYVAPPDVCNTYRALLSALKELELDMHQHVHKENSILFPAAEELERRFARSRP